MRKCLAKVNKGLSDYEPSETYNDDGSVVVRDAHDLLNEFSRSAPC